jgi:ribosomal-protein-serine acetyltransferase
MGDVAAWLEATPPARVTGRTVVLRRWVDDDLDTKLEAILTSLPALTDWMPWALGYDRAAGAAFLARTQAEWDARTTFGYAVRTAATDRIVGSVGLHARIGVGGLEIGYWVRSDATQRGHATRAAALATGVALTLAGVTHTEIHHDRANEISGRIPRRLGYTCVARVAREREAPGESGTALHWRMTADAYPDSAAARLVADETTDL